jgi:hypothetical protein
VIAFGDIVVVGGGCYGTFYVRQLLRARSRGAAGWRRLIAVDRDPGCRLGREHLHGATVELRVAEWGRFFDEYLTTPRASAAPDAIVPSPLMPHLMFEWLLRAARRRWPAREVEARPLTLAAGTPYDVLHPDGTRYVSFADWLCPVHCIEPATCPVIRGPRSWEMAEAVISLTTRLGRERPVAGPVLLVVRHRTYGVGMFDVADVLAGEAAVASAGDGGGPVDVVVGTVSSCHGAVSLLHLGATTGASPASLPSYIPA